MKTRSRRPICALLLAILLLVGLVPPASAQVDRARIEPALARAIAANPNGEFAVIVKRAPGRDKNDKRAREAEVEDELRGRGGKALGKLGLIDGHVVTLPARAIEALARSPRVKSVSLDHAVELLHHKQGHKASATTGTIETVPTGPAPTDAIGTPPAGSAKKAPAGPSASSTTTATTLQSVHTLAVNAPQVWSTYGNRGAGVAVAVLDSGVSEHPDLSNVVFGVDITNPRNKRRLTDEGGHGLHVAGIIAGNGNLSNGAYQGVAPGARIVSVKVTTNDGRANYSSLIKGLEWVVLNAATHNIRVVNLSVGAPATASYAEDPLLAAVEMTWFRGVVVVTSAGNSGPGQGTVSVPGNDPYVITVGASDDNRTPDIGDDLIPAWTSRGPTPFDGLAKPDLVAPGRKVISLRSHGSHLDQTMPDRREGNYYFRLSGTSMASAVVSGVAALVIAQNPRLTPNQVKYVLMASARALPHDRIALGAGLVDALAAVQMAARGLGPDEQANQNLKPNRHFAMAVYPVVRMKSPVWRDAGYQGKHWVNGSWDNGSWDNGSWENGSWENGAWENLAWEKIDWGYFATNGSWDNGSWDNLALENGSWDNGSWDNGSWDNGSWDNGSWDNGSWDNGSWNSAGRAGREID